MSQLAVEIFTLQLSPSFNTVALIAGGHTFGKTHGAGDPSNVGPEPEGASIEQMGFGWKNSFKSGKGVDTITSGLEGAWTPTPIKWDSTYFDTLFGYEWELTKSPAGAQQWTPKNGQGAGTVPDAHDSSRTHAPMMATTDLALIKDPKYLEISKRFHENIEELEDAFARAWYKLTHRDMGPISRYLGKEVPSEVLIWQDPIPTVNHELIDNNDIGSLKAKITSSGLSNSQLVSTAWASASSYRGTDKRGGANGARIQLSPQNKWEVNEPNNLNKVLDVLLKYNVKATFFCIGNQIEKEPEILKRIISEGHIVGNHSYSHSNFFGIFSTQKVIDELHKTREIILNITGKNTLYFRPPFGVTNPRISRAIKATNYKAIGWNIRSLDTVIKSEEEIFKRVKNKIKPGGIILFHDTSLKTVSVLERLLLFLQEEYEIVPIDYLLNESPYANETN